MTPLLLVLLLFGLDVEEKETIQKSLAFSRVEGSKRVRIDNLNGGVKVQGYDGNEVRFVVRKTIRAIDQDHIRKAKEEMPLQLSEKDNTVDAFVDAPYRCKDGGINNYRGWRYYGYEVRYDFEVQVPVAAGLWVHTINGGEVTVERVSGDYEVENVNGGIAMRDISGAGRAHTINGPVKVSFRSNPKSESFFGSLNGIVEVAFLPDLSADLRFKTFNGRVYTDFEVTPLPVGVGRIERRDGKQIYRSDAFSGVRVGRGGPEIKFDAFNGDIRVLKKEI